MLYNRSGNKDIQAAVTEFCLQNKIDLQAGYIYREILRQPLIWIDAQAQGHFITEMSTAYLINVLKFISQRFKHVASIEETRLYHAIRRELLVRNISTLDLDVQPVQQPQVATPADNDFQEPRSLEQR